MRIIGNQRLYWAAALVATTTGVRAQSLGSFITVDGVQGLRVTSSFGDLRRSVSLAPGATFQLNGANYPITEILGFLSLSDGEDMHAAQAPFSTYTVSQNNIGRGGIAGWWTSEGAGVQANQSQDFDYLSLNTRDVSAFGYRVRVNGNHFPSLDGSGINSNVGFIRVNPVPEPTSLAALGLLAVGLKKKRPRRSS